MIRSLKTGCQRQFVADYKELIAKFKALESKPRIFISRPIPAFGPGNYGIEESRILAVIPMVDSIAKDEKTGVIDMHKAFAGKEELVPDRITRPMEVPSFSPGPHSKL